MSRSAMAALIVCGAIFLVSCAPSAINPGDKIGDFLITTGDAESVSYGWGVSCVQEGTTENYRCDAKVGRKVNVSENIYGSGATDLETMWTQHTHEIFINGRPVNLEAFGWLEAVHPHVGAMRQWNVAILASAPGEIPVRNTGVVDGDPFDSRVTFSFSGP
ncbi:MAG: hypothetical protein V1755_14960 [Chloroflexota bacterium]